MEHIYFGMGAKVYFERGGLEKYIPEVKNYGKKILIVSGKTFIFKSGLYGRISKTLSENGVEHISYSGVNPEPDTDDVDRGARLCAKEGCDCILAVGGGSAMDAGKAIAVVSVNGGSVRGYFGEMEYAKEPLPVFTVPTTCGTGSEVTRFAVIVDRLEKTKKTLSSEKIIPKVSILDSNVLKTLPQKLILATGMDAFSHGAESFLSARADALSKMFARESIKLLWEYLPQAYREPENIEIKEKIFLGSLIAGLALNKTGTIIVHGMGYSLTIKHNVHHGTANAVMLPYVFEYLKENGYAAEMSELEEIWGDTGKLKGFVAGMGLPSTLGGVGVIREEIDELTDLSVVGTKRSMKNMKMKMERSELKKILERAM
ncbi:MAG: iron-containing alcohol dehydrogenase [Candidatus Omnitrophica bacterium]|nr:iron-containing alcohol dehydrogenase [Candidatus Omnitrophota bacterium]